MTWTEWMGVVTSAGLGAMGLAKFLQARKNDAVAVQAGTASNHLAGTEQIIKGFNLLLDQAQDTIVDDRQVIQLLEGRVGELRARADEYATGWSDCRAENARLRRKYGENDDTPEPPTKGT